MLNEEETAEYNDLMAKYGDKMPAEQTGLSGSMDSLSAPVVSPRAALESMRKFAAEQEVS